MNQSAAGRGLADLLVGRPGPVRTASLQTLLALALLCVYCAAQALTVGLGLSRPGTSAWLMAMYLGQGLMFYGLVRSGLSLRLSRDPALTRPQMLVAMTTLVLAYTTLEDGRGALVSMPVLVLMFGALGLTPRQTLQMGGAAAVSLTVAIGWTAWHAPSPKGHSAELLHLAVGAINIGCATALAYRISQLVHRLRQQKVELQAALLQIQAMATRDELTGLSNRRHLHELLTLEVERARREGAPFCVGLLDLDLFKRINDQYGHVVGDRVLRGFGEVARGHARVLDVLGRWGGEEFLIIMANRSLREATPVMERVRRAVAAAAVGGMPQGLVTVSAGLVQFKPGEPITLTLERADRGLYAAKAAGRNCVYVVGDGNTPVPARAGAGVEG